MTVMDLVQAQKADPANNQVITWLKDKKLDTIKVGKVMAQQFKAILEAEGTVVPMRGSPVLIWKLSLMGP